MANFTNTGPGGFEIDGQQLLFDLGMPEPASANSPYGTREKGIDVSEGFVDSNGKPKDLTVVVRTKLGQYLSDLTKGNAGQSANRYPIGRQTTATSITDTHGLPALQSPAKDLVNNDSAFAPDQLTLSSLSDAFAAITTHVKKGKAARPAVDGNDLLPGLPGNSTLTAQPNTLAGAAASGAVPIAGHSDTTRFVKPYQDTVMTRNRFTSAASSAAFLAGDVGSPGSSFNPSLTNQGVLGSYDKNAPTIDMGRLAAVGPLLTMRAGIEQGSNSPGANPNGGALQAGALLPGLGQLGVQRIDQNLLLAKDILDHLTTDELDSSNVISPGSLSWGALNNTDDPFSGVDALGMLALSTALVAGVEVVIDALGILLGIITPSLKKPAKDAQGRYSLGEYYPGTKQANKSSAPGIGGALSALTSLNFGALLGLQPTNFPFNQALTTGLNAFFQVQGGGGIGLNQLVGAVTSSTDSPGFNVVVCRAIVRSSVTIIETLKKIGGNPMNVINSVLSLIDTIRSSKLISACNVFAMLGDAQLSIPASYVDGDATGGQKLSALDNLNNELSNAVQKSRLQGTLKLAWASNRAPANILLPSAILAADAELKNMGQFDPTAGLQQDSLSKLQSTVTLSTAGGRIDTDAAREFEATLDAEYMPFYFHDVRTNEMVAFHAFLAALSDDYAAAYEKTEGFGRVEAVKIYKGTERRINMAFYVAATSVNDFDEMWVKINKLVTMVYPQFTKGMQLQDASGKYTFTQPFSQLMGASPMIRIRLGNLLHSNYSRFGLARLFGMGNPEMMIDGKTFPDGDAFDQSIIDNLATATQNALRSPNGETYYVAPGSYSLFTQASIGPSLPSPPIPGLGSTSGPQGAPTFSPQVSSIPNLFVVKAVSTPASSLEISPAPQNMLVCEVQINDDPQWKATFKNAIPAIENVFDNDDLPLNKVVGMKYLIPVNALTPTNDTKQALLQKTFTSNGGSDFATAMQAFLNPDGPSGNAIAKSFKESGGKGLAGFIETMNFDWFDKVTWETDINRQAPKICKVTIGFSPIHDITPGLDHMGFNRAPIYPVGLFAPRNDAPPGGV